MSAAQGLTAPREAAGGRSEALAGCPQLGHMTAALPVNQYGNIDVRAGVPDECVHISGQRLQPTCRSIGIPFAPAMVGFESRRGCYFALTEGVVILKQHQRRMRAALKARAARTTPEMRARRAKARQVRGEREVASVAEQMRQRYPSMPDGEEDLIARHAWAVGSRRVGRCSGVEDPIKAAVIAHVRHNYTDYEDRLHSYGDRKLARAEVAHDIAAVIKEWMEETTQAGVALAGGGRGNQDAAV